MSTQRIPQPQRNTDNAPFIDAWKSGRLTFQRCCSCQKPVFYPRPMCPHCWADDLEWEEAKGSGTIVSFSIVHKAGNAALQEQVPIVVAEILLDEGFSMIARVIIEDVGQVASGRRVNLVSPAQAARYPLPTFDQNIQKV